MATPPSTGPSQPNTPLGPPSQFLGPTQPPAGPIAAHPTEQPAIDILDNTDEIWVFVDIPGFKKDETQIRGDETTLVISGERFSALEEGRSVYLQERPVRVDRTIVLPGPVDIEHSEATFEDGVCKITLPKLNRDRYTTIDIR